MLQKRFGTPEYFSVGPTFLVGDFKSMRGTATGTAKVKIPADSIFLDGELVAPTRANGAVLLLSLSRTGRSPKRQIAQRLRGAGFGFLLIDLLTPAEHEIDARTRHLRFDMDLLTRRLVASRDWLLAPLRLSAGNIGVVSSNTGTAAALFAASSPALEIGPIVSVAGRPDLAAKALARVKSPVLLIEGGRDEKAVTVNRRAYADLRCEKSLKIIPDSTSLFNEPRKIELVAQYTADWFTRFLTEE